MDHNYYLEFENIIIRPLDIKDIEKLRIWRNDSKNNQFLKKIPHITKETQREWYENYLNNPDEITFAIEENKELKRLVGSVSLYDFNNDQVEFGKILIGDEEAHGKKVGLNATKAVLTIAFELLKMKRVCLKCYGDNEKAMNIYKTAGFTIKDKYYNDGKLEYLMDKKVDKEK